MQVQQPNANPLKTNAGQCSRHGKVTQELQDAGLATEVTGRATGRIYAVAPG